jgi:segregation and condensation protein A
VRVRAEERTLNVEEFEKSPLYLAYRLVEEGKIDPWDVDLERLINEYLEEIRRIELRDLRVPARVVAFATFLIKKQLEIIFPKPPRVRRKRITLEEIEREFESTPVEELVEIKPKRKTAGRKNSKGAKREKILPPPPLHRATLEEVLEYLVELLKRLNGERVPFSRIATKNDFVAKFWGLLNLANEGKVNLFQESAFGEIYFSKA